jgi:ribosome assembly protein 4
MSDSITATTAATSTLDFPNAATTTNTTTNDNNNNNNTGGLAWAGSLVGSLHPYNLGYRNSNHLVPGSGNGSSSTLKRYREAESDVQVPDNVQIQLRNRQGDTLAQVLDVPLQSSVDELSALVHSLLQSNDSNDTNQVVPYSFSTLVPRQGKHNEHDEVTIASNLHDFYLEHPSVTTEHVWTLVYQPLAIFRVRPVTRCTDTLPGHTEAVLHVQFSPDGRTLVSGGGDTTVRFWDVATALPKHKVDATERHKDHVLCTAWSPDGTRVASGDKRGWLWVWNPTTGHGQSMRAHTQWITNIAWEPLHRISVTSSTCTYTCERVATSSKDATIKVWNVRTRAMCATLCGHTDSVEAIQWGGEGFLYSASRDRTIKVWNVDEGRYILVRTLTGHGHRVNTLAVSSAYTLRTGPFDHRGTVHASPQAAWEAAKKKYTAFRQTQGPERLVSGSDDFTLMVWHPESSKHAVKRLTGHQQAVNHLAFSPDGRTIASASFDKKVKLWNGYTGDYIQTLHGHVGSVYQVAWSPDSRYLVSASKDSTAKLWQVPSGKPARETLPVYALDWAPNGAGVATGSKDRTIKIWKH